MVATKRRLHVIVPDMPVPSLQYHTAGCVEKQRKIEWARSFYFTRWPAVCLKCEGLGFKHYHATQWEPEDVDACPGCIQQGRCPRCQKFTFDPQQVELDSRCAWCGWTAQGKGCVVPPRMDWCGCHIKVKVL
jgi:hypothetical protein